MISVCKVCAQRNPGTGSIGWRLNLPNKGWSMKAIAPLGSDIERLPDEFACYARKRAGTWNESSTSPTILFWRFRHAPA